MKTLRINYLSGVRRAVLVAALTTLAFCTGAQAQQYYFSNFVGNPGVAGSTSGTGSGALFANNLAVAVDLSGNLIVADAGNQIIRKVTPAGVVTTLAGTVGVTGTVNKTGIQASFNTPNGVTLDGSGNIYVADSGNARIRKVTSAGVVTTLAGLLTGSADGSGTAVGFSNSLSVAADAVGNVYVADAGNNTIRKVALSGTVTTLAGTPGLSGSGSLDGTGTAAQFNNPTGIALDGSGNLFVADKGNNTIRQVTLTGTVTTLAGSPGVSGSLDATGTAALFNQPAGVSVDADGNIWVADTGNSTIRVVTPTGVVTTVAGTPGVTGSADGTDMGALFKNPTEVVVDDAGNIIVADSGNKRLSIGVSQPVTGGASTFNTAVGPVVSGVVDLNGTSASFWFESGTTTSYGSTTGTQSLASGTGFVTVTGTLSGVTLTAPHHYRIVVTNPDGTFYGADQLVNAPGYTVGAAVVTGSSVTFNATVNPNGSAGPASNKTNVLLSWQYGLTSGSYTTTTKTAPIGTGTAVVSGSLSSITIKKPSAALYYYRLIVASVSGTAYGPVQTFSTQSPAVTVATPSVTGTDATLSLTVNPNGFDTTVYVNYGLTSAYTSGTTVGIVVSGTLGATAVDPVLTGLVANTAYHYRVVTVNALGTVYGADQTFATAAMFGTAAIVSTKDVAPGITGTATFSVLGNPAINDNDNAAFLATIIGSGTATTITKGVNDTGIWFYTGPNTGTLIVRTGTAAHSYTSGSSVGTYATISDPVLDNNDSVAFLGTLALSASTPIVTATNNIGIWANTTGTLALVARIGDNAPDKTGATSPSGPVFASFTQFTLPDQGGVIVLAKLVSGKPGPGGVTSSNNIGIWAVDTDGVLKQIIRTGDSLTVNGKAKTITKLSIFTAPKTCTGQTRHFNNPGDMIYTAGFNDGTSGIVQSVLP